MDRVPAIEARNLFYSYRKEGVVTPVLKDFSLSIERGEFVAIQGPSGSGKSTLLYLLGLLASADSGQILIQDLDISSLSEGERSLVRSSQIGFIFQQFHLMPKTSVIENIILPVQYSFEAVSKEEAIARAQNYANLLGLSDRLQHYPNQLSGGQQQRVAICRALMNDPAILLADEPTGNLDSNSTTQTLELLRMLNRQYGKTIVIITHDKDVASVCDRVVSIKDGQIVDVRNQNQEKSTNKNTLSKPSVSRKKIFRSSFGMVLNIFSLALRNLARNKTRTALTMLGISIGIAAVMAMMTLGQFTKEKILAGYSELGVGTLMFYGYPNWNQRAIDIVPVPFRFFNWEKEIVPLPKVFPDVQRMSPVMSSWGAAVSYGGRGLEQDIRVFGVSDDFFAMSRKRLLLGRPFSRAEIEQKSGVCVIGYEIGEQLFAQTQPLGEVLRVTQGESSFGCRVVGVLKPSQSNKEYIKPNLAVYVPFTYFQAQAVDWWSTQIQEVMFQVNVQADVEKVSGGIKSFFEQRYGRSGRFIVDSDSVLIAQMRRFLSLFTVLLSSIAFVTLAVGGVGITNMMLVSVSERFREIGLKRALGATQQEIRWQFLAEAIVVCFFAGCIGLLLGVVSYHGAIWISTKLVNKVKFEWIFDWLAFSVSLCAIFIVGFISGIFPALKAERLQVIEALRSE